MKRTLISLSAAALVGTVLPISGGPAVAGEDKGDGAAKPAFSGYSSTAWAAPVKIEIYEPTIPIPATPQLEVELAYTKVEADSGSSSARASWLWPGDPVGEGMKTFVEQLGLPPQLGENGYPVQVNASQPSGEAEQVDEPFPGTVMRAKAGETTIAQAGFSPDGQVQDGSGQGGGKDGDGGGTPGLPGLPGLPGMPELPGLSSLTGGSSGSGGAGLLEQFGQAITGGAGGAGITAAEGDDPAPDPTSPGAPGLPPELAALVDFEGYTSTSKNVASGDTVVTTARSALGDVSLLGGTIVLNGVVVTSTSSSDGAKGVAGGKAMLGGLTIAGQEFSFGPDGFEAAGQHTDIPGLPDDPAKALEQLGIRIELPKPVRTTKGDQATSDMAGLRVDIDTSVLRKQLDVLPLDDLIDALPSDPPELKSTLQTILGLAPRVVVTLGNASTELDTVQGLDLPTGEIPDNDPDDSGAAGGPDAGGSGSVPTADSPSAVDPGSVGDAPSADGDLGDAALAGSGLPPLYSIPGAILVASIALAAVGGTWLRKMGAIALGGSGSCTHGLDSGLPDLRKA